MIGGYLGYWIGMFAGRWWGHDEAAAPAVTGRPTSKRGNAMRDMGSRRAAR